ncbi:hypothetical protein SODALDRAFT_27725 [Sodiomyces alkalinus F11]|uniref:Uncharacterized protein n=1 Tax=Sodiomyces alkalinus (strain CBS 110278 / VKM F-3762 / F11) TaxID=1314773 RepID=A0A3N2Q8A2_SODAK|nr:hypothetical protein SODALDRAFT_27725 [Sodiomyces alkalinus F11]ROT42970.1 hypothetical protein SODALDRAFT_27725 [Sodiomyces alkalinus F11]
MSDRTTPLGPFSFFFPLLLFVSLTNLFFFKAITAMVLSINRHFLSPSPLSFLTTNQTSSSPYSNFRLAAEGGLGRNIETPEDQASTRNHAYLVLPVLPSRHYCKSSYLPALIAASLLTLWWLNQP